MAPNTLEMSETVTDAEFAAAMMKKSATEKQIAMGVFIFNMADLGWDITFAVFLLDTSIRGVAIGAIFLSIIAGLGELLAFSDAVSSDAVSEDTAPETMKELLKLIGNSFVGYPQTFAKFFGVIPDCMLLTSSLTARSDGSCPKVDALEAVQATLFILSLTVVNAAVAFRIFAMEDWALKRVEIQRFPMIFLTMFATLASTIFGLGIAMLVVTQNEGIVGGLMVMTTCGGVVMSAALGICGALICGLLLIVLLLVLPPFFTAVYVFVDKDSYLLTNDLRSSEIPTVDNPEATGACNPELFIFFLFGAVYGTFFLTALAARLGTRLRYAKEEARMQIAAPEA